MSSDFSIPDRQGLKPRGVVAVVDCDPHRAQAIASSLNGVGYRPRIFPSKDAFVRMLRQEELEADEPVSNIKREWPTLHVIILSADEVARTILETTVDRRAYFRVAARLTF